MDNNKELERYNEAAEICKSYVNYEGDKRRFAYKRLAHLVCDLYMGRMDHYGKKLGLPLYTSLFE